MNHDCSGHKHDHVSSIEEASGGLFTTKEGVNQDSTLIKDPEEMKHFKEVVSAFFNYKHDSYRDIKKMETDFKAIPPKYHKLMKYNYLSRIQMLEQLVDINSIFLNNIVEGQRQLFDFKKIDERNFEIPEMSIHPRDVSKLRSTLRQFVRDWSKAGESERNQTYKPIIDEFLQYFPEPIKDGERIKVLFPGCGLGRLVCEFASRGYASQGNEFSYFMLLGSDFILNSVQQPEEFELYPNIHNWNNLIEEKDAFECHMIPDICALDYVNDNDEFSMVGGEFIEVYKDQKEKWDSIITCFFIDTAHNILEYIETIFEILKPGGIWINLGPLLYHYAGMHDEVSIELSLEEVKYAIEKVGFVLKKEETIKCSYAQERRTMMEVNYNAVFFTAMKPINIDESKA